MTAKKTPQNAPKAAPTADAANTSVPNADAASTANTDVASTAPANPPETASAPASDVPTAGAPAQEAPAESVVQEGKLSPVDPNVTVTFEGLQKHTLSVARGTTVKAAAKVAGFDPSKFNYRADSLQFGVDRVLDKDVTLTVVAKASHG